MRLFWTLVAVAFLPALLLWAPCRNLAKSVFGQARRPDAWHKDKSLPAWVSGVIGAALFVVCVVALRQVHISGNDLERAELTTLIYASSRTVLSVLVLGMCFAVGAIFLSPYQSAHRAAGLNELPIAITCFFLGASILGLVGTALGLAGLLTVPVALLILVPLSFLAPSKYGPYLRSLISAGRAVVGRKSVVDLTVHGFLAWHLLLALALLLVWKGLYPASAEADVWEHYLNYYREVLATGNVGPGEVWPHYWASKAAGLMFLVGLVSDEFAAQLVSWVFIVAATLIVIDLLTSASESSAWGFVGGTAFLAGVLADPSIGAFIRHHAVITAFIAYLVWVGVQIVSPQPGRREWLLSSAVVVVFYAGLYLAQVVPLFVAFFGAFIGAGLVISRLRFAVKPFIALSFAAIAGMLTECVISYFCTGIASLLSIRWFWPISDQAQFQKLVGDSGIVYLLYTNHDNPPWSTPWPWLTRVFRLQHFLPFFGAALTLLAVAVVARIRQKHRMARITRLDLIPALVAGIFLLAALVPPLVFRNESTMRLYVFLNFLLPVIVISLLKPAADKCEETTFKRLWVGCGLIVLSLTAFSSGVWPYREHIGAAMAYVSGRLSTAGALRKTADVYSEPERFEFIKAVRRSIGFEAKILTLSYGPGPASAFPRRGLMSEPMYTLGPRYREIIFGEPGQAVQALRERGINYFHLSLEGKLFSGVAFSRLFQADGLQRYFSVAYREGNQFLLTWRKEGDSQPLPAELPEVLELKQKALLVYPFVQPFADELEPLVEARMAKPDLCPDESKAPGSKFCVMNADFTAPVEKVLRTRMLQSALLPANRRIVEAIIAETNRELANTSMIKRLPELRQTATSQLQTASTREALMARIVSEIVTVTQIAVMNACIKRFGRPFCEPLTHRDERDPFGVIYRSDDSVARILRLDFSGLSGR